MCGGQRGKRETPIHVLDALCGPLWGGVLPWVVYVVVVVKSGLWVALWACWGWPGARVRPVLGVFAASRIVKAPVAVDVESA